MSARIAMLPGSFDPPTNGHIDIIRRTASLFDLLYVVVADNPVKGCLFTADERKKMLSDLFADDPKIRVETWPGLVVDFAREKSVGVMVRGVRALADFSYEFELAQTNKQLFPELEVLFIPCAPEYFLLRSSQIKEMAAFGADISKMVPAEVAGELKRKTSR